jgi:peptide/nickel transport system substrate-binding protein
VKPLIALARRKVPLAVLVVLIATGAVAAVAAGSGGQQKVLDTISLRLQQDWPTFDPMVDANRNQSWSVVAPAYDHLISWDVTGRKFVPYLASSFKQTPTSIQFTIRKGAKCVDGHEMTSLDVLNSIKRFVQVPKRVGTAASTSVGGLGNGPYHLHANPKKALITLTVDQPWRNFASLFANMPMICPAGFKALAADPRALETATYGSGPYTLVDAVHGDHVTYKLRPEWNWGPAGTTTKTMARTLIYKVVADDTTAANLLLTGGLDIAAVTGPDVDRMLANSAFQDQVQPNYNPVELAFNFLPGHVTRDDAGLRHAIVVAIDKKQFNQAAYAGRAIEATSVFRPGSECYDASTKKLVEPQSIDKAKQILLADGYTYSGSKLMKNGQQLHLDFITTPLLNSGPDYITNVLQQLGIDVTLRNLPGSAYGAAILANAYDVGSIRGSQADPSPGIGQLQIQGLPNSLGGTNAATAAYQDTALQKEWQLGYQTLGAASCKHFSNVQLMLQKNWYIDPLVFSNFDVFGKKTLSYPPLDPSGLTYPIFYIKAK